MGFETRWSGRVAGFQVSASVTSRETQPAAAPLPPEFSPRLPGRISSLMPLLASGSLPTFGPSARRKGSLGSNAGLLVLGDRVQPLLPGS